MSKQNNPAKNVSRSFMLNKLVRDKVFENIVDLGQNPHYEELTGTSLKKALTAKLLEEATEYADDDEGSLEELADILEVIEALSAVMGANFEDLRKIQMSRRDKRGSFTKGYYISQLDVPAGDKWADYYAAEPDRFPEIISKNE